MPAQGGIKYRRTEGLARVGLEILYARPGPKDRFAVEAARDLPKELRERYWIREASDSGVGAKSWANIEMKLKWPMERIDLGKDRNDPGDGFRYVFRSGTGGTDGRVEWFEVTEVFEGVEAQAIESFMRLENGGATSSGFDRQSFLTALDMGIPRRAAQRRAADKVLVAIERKLAKSSYEGMVHSHGYGTLIVGLPLWFATEPLDPLRVENVIDDFATRVGIGLKLQARQLRMKNCPFWRIVVVWKGSVESIREWKAKARLDIYEDPSYRSIGSLPINSGSLTELMLDALEQVAHEMKDGDAFGGFTRHMAAARPDKKQMSGELRLPPAVAELRRHLDEFAERQRESRWARVKTLFRLNLLAVLCFVRVYGIGGLERWIIAKLSPSRWITHFAMRRRALRLYRVSRGRALQ